MTLYELHPSRRNWFYPRPRKSSENQRGIEIHPTSNHMRISTDSSLILRKSKPTVTGMFPAVNVLTDGRSIDGARRLRPDLLPEDPLLILD